MRAESVQSPDADDPLDRLVARIIEAAEAGNFEALASLMTDDFETSMVDDAGPAHSVSVLREDPRLHLGNLVVLLRGECAFFEGREHLICPRALADPDVEEWGDALRTHFQLRDGTWRWVAFVVDDTVDLSRLAPAPTALRPSASPLIPASKPAS